MGKIVVLAEKPSVAQDIARVLGCRERGDGYVSGERYLVTWAVGHLVTLVEPDELDEYQKIFSERYDGLLEVYKSAPYFLELMPFGVSKGSMLPLLLDHLGVSRDELIAFGDHYNDMTMIGYAGMGVAMGNGEAEVKKIANFVCPSNDEDGIAETLHKFVLK